MILEERMPKIQMQTINEWLWVPNKTNEEKLRPIMIKQLKTKDKENLNGSWAKRQITLKGATTWLTADLSTETMEERKYWNDIFEVLKNKKVNIN